MPEDLRLGDSRRTNDFMAIAAAMLVVSMIVLRSSGLFGEDVSAATALLGFIAYVVSILRRDWLLLSAAAGLVGAALLAFAISRLTGAPWEASGIAMVWLLVVWVPWPSLGTRRSLLVLWALAWAPILMLMMGPPFLGFSWAEPLWEGGRIGGNVGFNEVGIPAALAAIAALALRLDRDTWIRFGLLAASLVLAAGAGTRVVLPALAVTGLIWIVEGRKLRAWRGWVVEAVPWILYVAVAARPLLLRTVEGLGEGLDQASSGRLEILSQYWAHARTSLLTGRGIGATESLLLERDVEVIYLPHNGFMTLMIDVGVPGMIVALTGLTIYVLARVAAIDGEARWLLRVPLLVLLPALFVLDHGLVKAFLTVPIILFSAAAPWLSRELSARASEPSGVQYAPRRDSTATTVLPSRNRS